MRRLLLAVAFLLVASLAVPLGVSSGQQSVKLHPQAPTTVSAVSSVDAKLKVKDMAATFGLLCVEFQFEGDMLDPGEGLLIDLGPDAGAFGATNVSDAPETGRLLCTADPVQLAEFADGRERFAVTMEWGSVTIAGATVIVEP